MVVYFLMLGIEIGNKINFKHFVNLEKQKDIRIRYIRYKI